MFFLKLLMFEKPFVVDLKGLENDTQIKKLKTLSVIEGFMYVNRDPAGDRETLS